MKRIAFIGLEFHKKTKSSKFFLDILNKYFQIDIFWTFADNPEDGSDKNAFCDDYFAIVIWQIMPDINKLKSSYCQNIILIPMYDYMLSFTNISLEQYRGYKFLNFSNVLHEKMSILNMDTKYFQYFPNVPIEKNLNRTSDKVKIFFWQRSQEINFELIKKIIPKENIDCIYFHKIEDKNDTWFQKPSLSDIDDYNIKFSSWFNNKGELIDIIRQSDIVIAPRLYEGIGMLFLESMSLGKCVISPNLPTMNEYIVDYKTGILFDINRIKKLNIDDYSQIGKNAQKYVENGYKDWKSSEKKIIEFIVKSIDQNINIDNSTVHTSNNIQFSRNLNHLYYYLNLKFNDTDNLIIYGAGTGGKLLVSILTDKIKFFVDKDENLQNTKINDINVVSPEILYHQQDFRIFISIFGREKLIYDYLVNDIKYPRNKIFTIDFF